MCPEPISHSRQERHKNGYTYRMNPITNMWEWWMLADARWEETYSRPYAIFDTKVSYESTWAEPIKVED